MSDEDEDEEEDYDDEYYLCENCGLASDDCMCVKCRRCYNAVFFVSSKGLCEDCDLGVNE